MEDKDSRDRLKELRKKKLNMTQEQFCAKLSIKRSTLSNIEGKRLELTDRNMDEICIAFSVNRDWLETGTGGTFVSAEKAEMREAIIAMVNKLNYFNLTQMHGYVQALYQQQMMQRSMRKKYVYNGKEFLERMRTAPAESQAEETQVAEERAAEMAAPKADQKVKKAVPIGMERGR